MIVSRAGAQEFLKPPVLRDSSYTALNGEVSQDTCPPEAGAEHTPQETMQSAWQILFLNSQDLDVWFALALCLQLQTELK